MFILFFLAFKCPSVARLLLLFVCELWAQVILFQHNNDDVDSSYFKLLVQLIKDV